MARRGGRLLPLLALSVLVTLPARAQDDWVEHRSPNFRILGDAGPDRIAAVAADLEAFQSATDRFFRTIGIRRLPPATVLVLDGRGDLRRTGLEGSDQFFFVGADRTFAVLTDPDGDEAFEGLLHDYFLAIADRIVPNAPLWMKEGLSALYRTTRWDAESGQIETGRGVDAYVRLLDDARDRLGLVRLSEIASLAESPDAELFRAESWALMHYLVTRDQGSGHDRTAELVRWMAEGRTFEDAAAEAFGMDAGELLAGFDARLEAREAFPRLTLAADVGETRIAGEVAEIEAATTIGAVLVAAGRVTEAETQLARALEMDRLAFGPYIALAPLLIEQGRFDELRYGFEQAMRRADPPALGRYYYALSIIRENPSLNPTELARVRRELETAIDLNPDFADAHHQLAASFLDSGEDAEEAVRMMERALDLSPDNPEYLVTYSRFLIGQGRFDDARQVLSPLVDRGRDSAIRDRAVEIVESIAGRTGGRGLVGEGFAEIRTNTGPGAGLSEPAPGPAPAAADAAEDGAIELTRVVRGERRTGLLTLVDCRQGLALTLEEEGSSAVFSTDSPEQVEFTSSAAVNVGREIRCGVQDPPVPVVVTFQPAPEGSQFAGVPVRVEFVED